MSISSYYIRQNQQISTMKPKKKPTPPIKKTAKKPTTAKPIVLIDKTIVTTKQKTHTTIQDHFQMGDHKKSIRNHKNLTPRNTCTQKMEQCNLSPFSSNERSSLSPKYPKKVSPYSKDPKEKKKVKSKPVLLIEKQLQKKKIQVNNRSARTRINLAKEQANQSEYETLFMRRLDEKKITEMSEESSASIPKITKLQIPSQQPISTKKSNATSFRELKHKINEKYMKELPGLKKRELKFLCSIVLIQRLWRQHKIKSFISEFMSPRVALQPIISADSHREANTSKLDITITTQQHTLQLIRKYHHVNNNTDKKLTIERQLHSTQIQTAKKAEKQYNLKDLELSSQLTPQKQAKIIKLVQCLRDISFHKPKKHQARSKINVFNLQSSLSEKCLMQKFYEKVFKDFSFKKNNFQIFSSKKEEKQLQRSIQLINTMKTPEKAEITEIIQVSQRFETELQSNDQLQSPFQKISRVEVSVETDEYRPEHKEINTLKQLNMVAEGVIFMLLNEFSEEFHSFTARAILKKKKKSRMPGLQISIQKIRQYLTGLTGFMLDKYEADIVHRFCLVNPSSILKIHHEFDEQQEEYFEEQEQDEFDLPIIPNTLFYQYQIIYEDNFFTIPEQDKKYQNFLEGLIKIHNLFLRDCLSEVLEKKRIERIILPWDQKFDPYRSQSKKKYDRKNLQQDLSKIVEDICGLAFMRVGQFHRRIDDFEEQKKMLKSISQQYQNEGNDWSPQYEHLEVRMQLAKMVEKELLLQLANELLIFF